MLYFNSQPKYWPLLSSGDLVLTNEHIISFFNFFSFLTSVRGISVAWVLVLSEASTWSVLKNFAKFTRKDLCQSLLFNKVAALKPETSLKKGLWRRCFLWNLRNFKNTFFTEHLRTTAYMFWLSFNQHLFHLLIWSWIPCKWECL